eukprot:9495695-Pyramimonas_sp.AAC.1
MFLWLPGSTEFGMGQKALQGLLREQLLKRCATGLTVTTFKPGRGSSSSMQNELLLPSGLLPHTFTLVLIARRTLEPLGTSELTLAKCTRLPVLLRPSLW